MDTEAEHSLPAALHGGHALSGGRRDAADGGGGDGQPRAGRGAPGEPGHPGPRGGAAWNAPGGSPRAERSCWQVLYFLNSFLQVLS